MNTLYNMMTVSVRKQEVKIQRLHVDGRARTEATADCAARQALLRSSGTYS